MQRHGNEDAARTARQRWYRAVVGVLVAALAVVLFVVAAPVDSAVRHLVADVTSVLGTAAAAAVFARAGWRAAGDERWWRWLVALALFSWLPAHSSWAWYHNVDPDLFPNAANALYHGLPLFAFFALLSMVRGDRAAAREHGVVPSHAVNLLDGVIIVGSMLALSWGIAVEAIRTAGDVPLDRLLVVASYTATDLVVIAVATLLAVTLHGVLRPPLAWLVAGLLAIGFSHVFYLYALSNAMEAPPLANVGYVVAPAMFLSAALVPDRRSLRRAPRVPLLLLPYVPLAAVCAFTLFNTASTGQAHVSAVYFLVGVVALVVVREIVSLRQLYMAQQQLAYQATHDPLTGVFNRALLVSELSRELSRDRPRAHRLGLLYVDLDHFKEINDTQGHGAGDAVLRAAAKRLTACIRSTDTIARMGGDEFVVLLDPAPENPHDFTRRILAEFRERGNAADSPSPVGASIGYVRLRSDDTPDQALTRADAAMYRAKHSEHGISIDLHLP